MRISYNHRIIKSFETELIVTTIAC